MENRHAANAKQRTRDVERGGARSGEKKMEKERALFRTQEQCRLLVVEVMLEGRLDSVIGGIVVVLCLCVCVGDCVVQPQAAGLPQGWCALVHLGRWGSRTWKGGARTRISTALPS